MAKSPLAKGSKRAKPVRSKKNVVPLHFTIPYKTSRYKRSKGINVSHLLHFKADKRNDRIESRIPYLRSFCKKAQEYVDNGNRATTVTGFYESFQAYIKFCDEVEVEPFSEEGYLKYAGNDGELRHRINVYEPSKKIWERQHGDELGCREASAGTTLSGLRSALSWCGFPVEVWKTQHRGFSGYVNFRKGYSDTEEQLLVSRLSELFFVLAPQLIAAKESELLLHDELPVTIDLGGHKEIITIPTSLKTNQGVKGKQDDSIKSSAAFNMTMGAAYHLMCFFTSLNDSNIRSIAHPININMEERDKSLQTVTVSSFKARANKQVNATLSNETEEPKIMKFDVNKRDGVTFIKTLEKLSKIYGSSKAGKELLFTLNGKQETTDTFNLAEINKVLTSTLHLVSPYRISALPRFKELFYAYHNNQTIEFRKTINTLGRVVVCKTIHPIEYEDKLTSGKNNSSYCILSCYTDLPLKGILLPLSYSEKDSDGNITISFKYRNGDDGSFTIPAMDKKIIQDIEKFATERADKQKIRKNIRLLLKKGGNHESPKDWKGISPISSSLMKSWSIDTNEYFIQLQSSRWREMTSSQEYDNSNIGKAQSILQNTLNTINKHYVNGDPRLNQTILSQGVQVLEQIAKGCSLDEAKEYVASIHAIPMLAHDEWLKKKAEEKAKTNPNGIICNGQQRIKDSESTQRKTNKSIGVNLPCAEYDMCYKCKSAKAVDDVQAIYKLISFIDVLKEVLDLLPDAKAEVFEKVEAYEYTLDGASNDVYEDAMDLFKKNGRHLRVSIDHAILSINL
ncbi:hypothetical protein AB4234_09405 [Vibrio cyclitrophicus]